MGRIDKYKVQFVDYMPDAINQGILYVSMRYAVVIHLCACGCGEKVVTPLSPNDWKLTFDGESISLYPSIGNWDFPCRSHYWIKHNRVINAEAWDSKERANKKKKRKKKSYRWKLENTYIKQSPKEKKGWKGFLKSLFF